MPARKSTLRKLAKRKNSREHKKPGFIVRRVIIALLGVLVLIVAWELVSSWRDRLWTLGTRFTVVVASDDPTVYSYNPANNTITFFKIPANTQMDAAHGYGHWLAGSLWGLGMQEKKEGLILAKTIQKEFGIPIDGWIGAGGEEVFSPRTLSWPLATLEAIRSGRFFTNLTLFDRLNLFLGAGRVGRSDRSEIALLSSGVIKKEKLPDGLAGFVPVPERAETVMTVLRDDKIIAEIKTVKVVNAAGKSGLGQVAARVINIMGLRVISVDTAKEKFSGKCLLKGSKKSLDSISAKRLITLFECDSQISETIADLEIVLGTDAD